MTRSLLLLIGTWLLLAAPVAAAPLTGEIPVNTTTAGDQDDPSIGADAAGNSVVAWEGTTNVRDDFARRYDAAGNPLTPELPINPTKTGAQINPAVAVAPDGDFVVVWQGPDGPTSHGIFARLYDADGTPLTAELPVNVTVTGDQETPEVAIAPSGDFVVAWQGLDADGSGIAFRRFNEAGVPKDADDRQANVATAGGQRDPDVAVAGDGDFAIVWEKDDVDGEDDVAVRWFGAGGAAETSETPLHATPGDQDDPAVAMDPSGRTTVVFEDFGADGDGDAVFLRSFSATGTPRTDTRRVNTTTARDQEDADVALDGEGRALVAWENEVQDEDVAVVVRRFAVDGTPLTEEVGTSIATAGDQDAPTVASDPQGEAAVAWESEGQDGELDGVFLRLFDRDPPVAQPAPGAPQDPGPAPAPPPSGPSVVQTSAPAGLAALPRANQVIRLAAARRCVRGRRLRVRLGRAPLGTATIAAVRVFVNGKRVRLLRGASIPAAFTVRGLPRRRAYRVRVTVTLADGRKLTSSRRYRACSVRRKRG